MDEKISVIIPLYNKEKEIKRTLDSVLSQTFQNFEVIVIDDHSRDRGPAIVRDYNDPRISIIEQDHRGVSYTRNHGVDLATSDFIALLDADDEMMPNHLRTILGLIKKYPDAGMFTDAYKIYTKDGKTAFADYKYIPTPPWEGVLPDYFRSVSFGDYPVGASGVVIPKKIFHEMGGFPKGYWYGEDADLFGKIAMKYPVAFSWEYGILCHHDAANRATDRDIPLDYIEPFVKTAQNALMNGEVPEKYTESVNEFIWILEIRRAIRNVRAGHADIAESILKECHTKWHYSEKMKWLLLAKVPYPVFLFLREFRRNILRIARKK